MAVRASQAPVEIGRRERPLVQHEPARVGPGPHLGADLRRDHLDLGARLEQRLDLAGGDAPGADHDDAAAAHEQVHRVAGETRARPGASATVMPVRSRARGRAGAVPRRSW